MIVQHNQLWQTNPNWSLDHCFEYSKQAELALANLLNLPNPQLSKGFNNEYDIYSNNTTFEVKFQNTSKLRLEFRQANNFNPSGIAVSKSNFWIVICKGFTRDGYLVGKVRQYNTKSLKRHVRQTIDEDIFTQYNYLQMNPRDVDHIWLGDIFVTQDTWDLSSWRTLGYQLAFTPPNHGDFPS